MAKKIKLELSDDELFTIIAWAEYAKGKWNFFETEEQLLENIKKKYYEFDTEE